MKIINFLILGLVVLSFAAALCFYPQAPERMASHWNSRGEVDGYLGKFWGLFLLPIIVLAVWLLFLFIPKIDPLKENLEKFRKYFDTLIFFIILFLFYIYALSLIWNFKGEFNMSRAIMPAVGFLFVFIGWILPKTERTWFVGIRTPWTLSSDAVWEKTHRLGGKLFIVSGLAACLGFIFSNMAIWLALLPALASTVFVFAYSYFVYKSL